MHGRAACVYETVLCHRVRRSFPKIGKILTRIGNIVKNIGFETDSVQETILLERTMKRTFNFLVILLIFFPLALSSAAEMTLITEEVPSFNYTKNRRISQGPQPLWSRRLLGGWASNATSRLCLGPAGYQRLRSEPNVALFTTARTPEREALFHWVGPLYVSRMAFYARIDDPRRIDSIDDARQVDSIATYKDDSAEQILKSLGFTNLDSSNSPQSNVRKLASGHVDLWFFHSLIAPIVRP